MTAAPRRVAVLASGGGSNLQAILEYLEAPSPGPLPFTIALVAGDRPSAFALERARARDIPTAHIQRPNDGEALRALLERHQIDIIALAGYLKLVPAAVTRRWHGAVINIHPALLPKFGGPGMYGHRVHDAVLAAGERETGATVHFVDDVYDRGARIAWARVSVSPGDTAERLAARVLAVEHVLYPRVLHALAGGLVVLANDGQIAIPDPAALAAQLLPAPPSVSILFGGS